jgi:hypothetical protein
MEIKLDNGYGLEGAYYINDFKVNYKQNQNLSEVSSVPFFTLKNLKCPVFFHSKNLVTLGCTEMCRVLVNGLSCMMSNTPSSSRTLRLPRPAYARGVTVFSQITMHRLKYATVRLSSIRISMLIFPQYSERISIVKTIHQMHMCILRISKFRHISCCHCCYRYYSRSLITALQLSELPRNLSAEPPSNDHNNTKWHQRRNVETRKRCQIWKHVINIFCSKRSLQQPP